MRRFLVVPALVSVLSGCGKKGPLIYPDMLIPAAPGNVLADQSGTSIRLAFDLPDKDRSGRRLQDVSGVKISRRVTDETQDQTCRACVADYRQFKKIFVDAPEGVQRFGSRLVLLDGDVQETQQVAYLITAFTKDGVDGLPVASKSVSVARPVLPPTLRSTAAPTEILLEYTVATHTTGIVEGYNIYRSIKGEPYSYLPLNRKPITVLNYTDSGLARGVVYRYAVRAVVKLPNGNTLESLLSNEVEGMMLNDE